MLYYSIQNSFTVTVFPINIVGPGDKASILHSKRTSMSTSPTIKFRIGFLWAAQAGEHSLQF